MALIRPFKAIRPAPALAKQVSCLPYDVVNCADARSQTACNAESFFRVIRSEAEFPEDHDPYSLSVYERARKNLESFLQQRVLIQETAPVMYVYRQRTPTHSQTGLVAAVSLDEYRNGAIRIHEHTRPEKELDRTRHIQISGVQAEPVLLTYRARDQITKLLDDIVSATQPIYDFTSEDNVRHMVWQVPAYETLVEEFKTVGRLYIADGHHRSAAAARAELLLDESLDLPPESDSHRWLLAAIFPDEELRILPYNRLLLNGPAYQPYWNFSDEQILQKIEKRFLVSRTNMGHAASRGQIALYLSGFWYLLEPYNSPTDGTISALDVSILQQEILAPIFNITDPRTDHRISFIGGVNMHSGGSSYDSLERQVNSGVARAAFALHPVGIDDLLIIADEGGVMPPKSTWFDPKLRSGLFIYPVIKGENFKAAQDQ